MTIKSFVRGLQVLETLSLSFRPLTLTEVAGQMNLTLPATQRFLNTLCETGYVSRDKAKCYSLSTKMLSMTFNFLGGSTLSKLARPVMNTINAELYETVNLSILDGFEIVHLDRREGASVLKYSLGSGSRLPAHCTSTGKMLLSWLSDNEIRARIQKASLPAITPQTITSESEFIREIGLIRRRGYSLCDRELSMDLYSIAVPVINEKGDVIAALNVTASCVGIDAKKAKILERLLCAGAELSNLIGYRGTYPPVKP